MASAPAAASAKKSGGKMIWIIVCFLFAGAGATLPMFVDISAMMHSTAEAKTKEKKKKSHEEEKTVTLPFTDAVVNLAEDRMQRYLRIKMVLLVEAEGEKEVTEKLLKHKAAMKSWLIGHLAGKTLKDVSGTVGVNRLQREIFERFEDILYPDGHGKLINVLFEEYVVQ